MFVLMENLATRTVEVSPKECSFMHPKENNNDSFTILHRLCHVFSRQCTADHPQCNKCLDKKVMEKCAAPDHQNMLKNHCLKYFYCEKGE